MRLLNAHSLALQSFEDERKAPPYATLSHTWGDREVSIDEIGGPRFIEDVESEGVWKIVKCAEQARKDGLEWIWVDTCCIQKSSSAELSEAINSMFRWYKRSAVCYAYLKDVPPRLSSSPLHPEAATEEEWTTRFSASRVFTRGWTLQEMIAPKRLVFYSSNWECVGTKLDLASTLFNITKIPQDTLIYGDTFGQSVSQRMSWAANRQTTRLEDMAYCLLGIFNINMPLLYGEGERAFQRLQEEIFRITDDDTIFAWKAKKSTFATWRSLFATSPTEFADSGDFIPISRFSDSRSHVITNKGLQIQLPLFKRKSVERGWHSGTEFIAALKCQPNKGTRVKRMADLSLVPYYMELAAPPVGIYVKKIFGNEYIRVDADLLHSVSQLRDISEALKWSPITVQQRMDYNPWHCLYKCFRIARVWIKNTSPDAKLQTVQPEAQWNEESKILRFNENKLRRGCQQVVCCIFAFPDATATLALYFNPREEYRVICCFYKVKEGTLLVDIESLVRVINGEAILAVGLKVTRPDPPSGADDNGGGLLSSLKPYRWISGTASKPLWRKAHESSTHVNIS